MHGNTTLECYVIVLGLKKQCPKFRFSNHIVVIDLKLAEFPLWNWRFSLIFLIKENLNRIKSMSCGHQFIRLQIKVVGQRNHKFYVFRCKIFIMMNKWSYERWSCVIASGYNIACYIILHYIVQKVFFSLALVRTYE